MANPLLPFLSCTAGKYIGATDAGYYQQAWNDSFKGVVSVITTRRSFPQEDEISMPEVHSKQLFEITIYFFIKTEDTEGRILQDVKNPGRKTFHTTVSLIY